MNFRSCLPVRPLFFVLFWIWIIVCPSAVRGEPCLRVKRNGVIYYFFSNRDAKAETTATGKVSGFFLKRRPLKKMAPGELQPIIQEAGSRYGVPPSLIKAVIRVESNFNPTAVSPKGAQGLMQLMPETAADLQVADPYDIRENILAGTRYLRMLLEKFNHRLPQALAAYNAGPQRVEKSKAIPPIPETQDYVRQVCLNFLHYEAENSGVPKK